MRWVLFLPLLVLLALFALSNTQEVEIRLWPLDAAWAASLGIAMLLFGAAAFLVGAALVWASHVPERRRARRVEQAARLLEAELASIKARDEQARRAADMGRAAEAEVIPARGALGGAR